MVSVFETSQMKMCILRRCMIYRPKEKGDFFRLAKLSCKI